MIFAKNYARFLKKNNTWNIRRLVADSFVPSEFQDSCYKNLALSSKQSQCMKVGSKLYILLLQVSSHDFETTYILSELKNNAGPVQIKTKHQIFDT